jgi:hypothetical protein
VTAASGRIGSTISQIISITPPRIELAGPSYPIITFIEKNPYHETGLYHLEGVPVTVCVVATVAWEGSPGVAVFG